MGAAAFSAEETGKTDDTGVVEFKFEHGSNSLVITLSNKRVLRVIPDLTCADKGAPVRYEWIDTDKTEQQQARGISLCYAFANMFIKTKRELQVHMSTRCARNHTTSLN